MGVSEYVFIFISFILALAVGELVQGVARILRPGSDYKVDGLFWVFIVMLFGSMIEFWYGTWSFQRVESWTFSAMLVPIISASLLYLIADLCFSLDSSTGETSVYMRLAPRIWTLFAIYTASASLAYRVTGLFPWEFHIRDGERAIMIACMLVMVFGKKPWIHWLVLGSVLAFSVVESFFFAPITS